MNQKKTKQRHILLVEDDQDDQLFFIAALKQFPNTTCTIASDVRIALATIDRQEICPDAIFLDLHIPFNKSGVQFLAEIHKRKLMSELPIFVLSSDLGDKDMARLTKLGVRRSFSKPYSMNELEIIIKQALAEVQN